MKPIDLRIEENEGILEFYLLKDGKKTPQPQYAVVVDERMDEALKSGIYFTVKQLKDTGKL